MNINLEVQTLTEITKLEKKVDLLLEMLKDIQKQLTKEEVKEEPVKTYWKGCKHEKRT